MRALGLDTSTLSGSVGVADDAGLEVQLSITARATHSVRLLDSVRAALELARLQPADLDIIAVSSGPGSFTGLRIGMATAKGLGLALGRPVTGFSTLEATALAVHRYSGASPVCVVMDAGRGEVYRGVYALDGDRPRPLLPEAALPPREAVAGLPEGCLLAGDAAPLCGALLAAPARHAVCAAAPPIAATLARHALQLASATSLSALPPLHPNYLRIADAERTAGGQR